jgi:Flp pilus assembly protein TadG
MKLRNNNGQSLVEFALILPLFMLIVLGIFDFGRAIYGYSALHNAAREGARYGAVHPCDTSGIIDMAQQMAVGLGEGVTVTPTIVHVGAVPERIQVTVRFQFNTVTPLIGNFLGSGGSITLRSQSQHHIENPTACP